MYFRDMQGLHAFSQSKEHRDGREFLEGFRKQGNHHHITVFHETFDVAAGNWETVYLDAEPSLLGGTTSKTLDKDGNWVWTSSLVDGETGPERGAMKRLGKDRGRPW
jgi:fumagillin biosynthesis monooxygenase